MNKAFIGLGLILAATTALAAKPIKPGSSAPYSYAAAVDAEGKQVGVFTAGYLLTKIPGHPGTFKLETTTRETFIPGMYATGNLYYELSDCSGEPYAAIDGNTGSKWVHFELSAGIDGFDHSYPDPYGEPQTLLTASYMEPSGFCRNGSDGNDSDLVGAIPIDLGIVPPIKMELR